MDPISIQVLLYPAQDLPGEFISHTTYRLLGQGNSLQNARLSAESIIINFLNAYAQARQPLPQPERQLTTLDQVADYFSNEIPSGVKVFKDETITRETEEGLPKLVFDFYRLQN